MTRYCGKDNATRTIIRRCRISWQLTLCSCALMTITLISHLTLSNTGNVWLIPPLTGHSDCRTTVPWCILVAKYSLSSYIHSCCPCNVGSISGLSLSGLVDILLYLRIGISVSTFQVVSDRSPTTLCSWHSGFSK